MYWNSGYQNKAELHCICRDFDGDSEDKESVHNAGDLGLILWAEDPRRMEWQPIPVFLPAEFHGQSNLVGYNPWGRVGYNPWGRRELDTAEWLNNNLHTQQSKLWKTNLSI